MSICDFCFCERPVTAAHESFFITLTPNIFWNSLLRGRTKNVITLVEAYYCVQCLINTKDVFVYWSKQLSQKPTLFHIVTTAVATRR